mgnify:CR=1 FL=1
MPNLVINKDTFLGVLDQLRGDIAFQQEILSRLLKQMPPNYVDEFVKEYFFENIYEGIYYKMVHVRYKNMIHYYTDLLGVIGKLNEFNFDKVPLNQQIVGKYIASAKEVCGYMVTKHGQ